MIAAGLTYADIDKTVESEIKEVKVYLNGAQITQNAKTTVEAGTTNLIFAGLSSKINNKTLQASGKGNIVIVSVKHQINYLKTQEKSLRIIQLEDSLELLNTKADYLRSKRDALDKESEMLMSNKSIGGQDNGVSIIELQKAADFFRNRLNDINNQLLDVRSKEKNIKDEMAKISKQLNNLQSKKNLPTHEIVVVVSSKTKATIDIELKYIVTDAWWVPTYDIRAKDSKSPIQLQYKANVYQNSDVDWNNVTVSLSTGNPTIGGTQPIMNPWYVNFYVPPVHRSAKVSGALMPAAQKNSETTISLEEADTEGEMAQTLSEFTHVIENTINTEFKIDMPYTIHSDGKPHLLSIQDHNLNASYSHLAIPKLDNDAFLLARIAGWEDLNLMPGNANIYYEGSYIGESFIDPNNTEDTLAISLGRDKKVVVTRIKQKDFSNEKLIGTNIVKTFTFEITIRNTKNEAVSIQLEDQIPISQHQNIEVKVSETSGAATDQITGKLKWILNIPPAETVKKQFSFTIKYPKDKKIANLGF